VVWYKLYLKEGSLLLKVFSEIQSVLSAMQLSFKEEN
jgi:hypothetical protein